MILPLNNNDTICAVATPSGGALSIIRISGPKSLEVIGKICHDIPKIPEPRKAYFCHISDNEGLLDEVVITTYKTPHSYTGEDCAEITCHGSDYIVRNILTLLIEQGLRVAQPGEYTMRAFLNGKMDLSQAEAVADLINAHSRSAHHAAISQLRGNFSSQLAQLREQLLRMTSLLELELDFSDHEDLEFADRKELISLAEEIDRHISSLTTSFKSGDTIKKGIPIAIIGETNVGKSTLLNNLVKEERAIVSDIHGTTRDTIEETIELGGITFRFIDTAGLRETTDAIEQIGIERTYQAIKKANIIIWLTDERPSNRQIDEIKRLTEGKELIVVQNKIDLQKNTTLKPWICPMHFISAKEGIGIKSLEDKIIQSANIQEIRTTDVIVTSPRHLSSLTAAQKSLLRAIKALKENIPADLVAEDLRQALHELAEITGGEITSQETLNNIFSTFCVGK